MAYFNKGDFDRAIVDLTKAIELNPDAISYYYRGMMWLHLRELERAEADLIIAKEKGIEKHGIQLPADIAAMLTSQQ
jgi:tetratricopeptide (TPR) repeat protein